MRDLSRSSASGQKRIHILSIPETILIGSLPPPLTGQTIAFQMVCEGFQELKLPYRVINLSGGEHTRPEGGFSLRRLIQLLNPFFKALILLFGQKNLYLSAAQNWVGFLRDSIFITPGHHRQTTYCDSRTRGKLRRLLCLPFALTAVCGTRLSQTCGHNTDPWKKPVRHVSILNLLCGIKFRSSLMDCHMI